MTTTLSKPRLTKKDLDPTQDRSHLSPEAIGIEDRRFHLHIDGVGWRFKVAQHYAKRPAGDPPLSIDQPCRDLIAILRQRAYRPDDLSGLTGSQQRFSTHYDIAYQFRKTQAVRNAIDVLLLSGMPYGQIARVMQCEPKSVEVYALVFFDVQWLLDAPDAIAAYVFHEASIKNQTERAAVLKLGYRGGPEVALKCVDYLSHHHESHDLATELGNQRHRIDRFVLLEAADHLAIDAKKQQLLADFSIQTSRQRGAYSLGDSIKRRLAVLDQTVTPVRSAIPAIVTVIMGNSLVA